MFRGEMPCWVPVKVQNFGKNHWISWPSYDKRWFCWRGDGSFLEVWSLEECVGFWVGCWFFFDFSVLATSFCLKSYQDERWLYSSKMRPSGIYLLSQLRQVPCDHFGRKIGRLWGLGVFFLKAQFHVFWFLTNDKLTTPSKINMEHEKGSLLKRRFHYETIILRSFSVAVTAWVSWVPFVTFHEKTCHFWMPKIQPLPSFFQVLEPSAVTWNSCTSAMSTRWRVRDTWMMRRWRWPHTTHFPQTVV